MKVKTIFTDKLNLETTLNGIGYENVLNILRQACVSTIKKTAEKLVLRGGIKMIQAKLIPNLKPIRRLYKPKNAGITENICLSCPLEDCKPNECKRYKEEKEKLLKSLKRRRMK